MTATPIPVLLGRRSLRRLGMGLATVLGLRRRGFFLPYRYAGALSAAADRPRYPPLEDLLAARRPDFAAVLAGLAGHAAALAAIGGGPGGGRARWDQDWFPRLDAAVAYALVRDRAPRRIVEVGGGHSTRFLARAVRDGGLATEITTIDPAPRADIAGLGVRVRAEVVQRTPRAVFEALEPGDFLVVDSSHILMPGSDVDILLNVVLPALPAGVLVHFHDIFLPDGYPEDWDWRGYNEQSGVAALISGGACRVLFASHYAATRMAAEVAASAAGPLPLVAGAREAGLWLKTGGGAPAHAEMIPREGGPA